VAAVTKPAGIPGLVAAYAFDEGTTRRPSTRPATEQPTLLGADWTTQGKYGNAVSLDGTSLVSVADSTSLDLTTNMTLEAWVYPMALRTRMERADETAIQRDGLHTLRKLSFAQPASTYIFTTGQQGSSDGGIAGNTWTHIASTYDNSTLRLYVNGTQVVSNAVSGSIVQSTGPLDIGGNGIWGEYFQAGLMTCGV